MWAKYNIGLIDKIISDFDNIGKLTVEERCNCAGNNIQHNR